MVVSNRQNKYEVAEHSAEEKYLHKEYCACSQSNLGRKMKLAGSG